MKPQRHFIVTAALGIIMASASGAAEYQPNWASLKTAPMPEWLLDAKFGVYTHWGVYSVPAYKTNIYGAEMYAPAGVQPKHDIRAYHEANYGSIFEFGYKDFVPLFTAPRFDAAEWVRVMQDAGAKFGGICLVHHDGFCLWDSAFTKWDCQDMGPRRDIFGEIAREVRKTQDMKLLATFHHARTYGHHFRYAKDFTQQERARLDIFDPQYDDLYRNPETVTKEEFGTEWHHKIEEVMRKYQPDCIWFDGLARQLRGGIISEQRLLTTFADYYNQGTDYVSEVAIMNKLPAGKVWNFPIGFGLRCYENGRDMEPDPRGYFLIDRAIGYPWTWVKNKTYPRGSDYHIASIVDLVSRGGIFLISLTPQGDGSIPEKEKEIMAGIGRWLRINGEGVYGTRRWKICEEGTPAGTDIRRMAGRDGKAKWDYDLLTDVAGTAVRFMKKGNTLYAFVIGKPARGEIVIQTLARGNVETNGRGINSVSMLGTSEKIAWRQTDRGLYLKFPSRLPCEVAYGFKIDVNGQLDGSPPRTFDDGVARQGDWPVFNSER